MRIISGSAKGRKIEIPVRGDLRPMKNMVKQAIFNLIGEEIRGSRVADLFAGSGALGLEALSRGASFCHFIEVDEKTCEIIESNLRNLGFSEIGEVYNLTTENYLTSAQEKSLDLIFLTPPYEYTLSEVIFKSLPKLLTLHGIVALEQSTRASLKSSWPLKLLTERKYGITKILLFQKHE